MNRLIGFINVSAVLVCILVSVMLPFIFTANELLTPILILVPVLLILLVYFYSKNDISIVKISITWFFAGIALLSFALYAEQMFQSKVIASFWANFATVLISLGLINIVLQLKDSKDYFAQALSELIMQDSYLQKLNPEQLEKLKKGVLEKIFSNSTEFDKENSFYSFFNKNLQKYIGEPYRENYINSITITAIGNDFVIKDKLRYTAKAVGGKIQDHAKWAAVKNEIKELKKISLRIGNDEKFIWKHDDGEASKKTDELDYSFADTYENGARFAYSLQNMEHDGKLEVEIETEYIAANYKSLTLKVMYPTFNFTVILSHNESLETKVEAYGFDANSLDYIVTSTPTSTTINYRNWLLPFSGLFIETQPQLCANCSTLNATTNGNITQSD